MPASDDLADQLVLAIAVIRQHRRRALGIIAIRQNQPRAGGQVRQGNLTVVVGNIDDAFDPMFNKCTYQGRNTVRSATPLRTAFCRATASASGELSVA